MSFLSSLRTLTILAAAALPVVAQADPDPARDYPNRPVRVIVGYAAGGANDIVARALSQKLSDRLGQSVIVENRTGAGGIVGAQHVASADRDGYTLLFAPSSVFTTNPVMYKTLPYALGDFAPIASVVTYPFFLMVNAAEPIQSVGELTRFLKENPKRANFGGAAGIFQLGYELFKIQTGTSGEYIGYKGTNHSVNAVISGEILMTMADGAPASAALQTGRVRALAVTAERRAKAYPDVPTVVEAGFPELRMGSWMGLFAPAGTAASIVKKLEGEVIAITRSAEFQEQMSKLQVNADGMHSAEFGKMIDSDLARWRQVAREGKIEPTN